MPSSARLTLGRHPSPRGVDARALPVLGAGLLSAARFSSRHRRKAARARCTSLVRYWLCRLCGVREGRSAENRCSVNQAVYPAYAQPKDLLEKTIDQMRVFLRSHQP
jgi:hypothetical protein